YLFDNTNTYVFCGISFFELCIYAYVSFKLVFHDHHSQLHVLFEWWMTVVPVCKHCVCFGSPEGDIIKSFALERYKYFEAILFKKCNVVFFFKSASIQEPAWVAIIL